MRRSVLTAVAAAAMALSAASAGAQERPRVTYSESSGGSGPACVVGGTATDCGGSPIVGPAAPLLVGGPPVAAPFPVAPLAIGGSGVGDDTDVDRSTRAGTATAR